MLKLPKGPPVGRARGSAPGHRRSGWYPPRGDLSRRGVAIDERALTLRALIRDAGHFAAFTQPEEFLSELLTWVRPWASAPTPDLSARPATRAVSRAGYRPTAKTARAARLASSSKRAAEAASR